MTRIDFYQIESKVDPFLFACRLIDKVYRLGHQIHVHTANEQDTSALDDLLWTFKTERFVPHSRYDSSTTAPIRICHYSEPVMHQDVLVNLSGNIPSFFSRFDRVAEIVPEAESTRESARENYRQYKSKGYPLHYHKLSSSQ